MKSLFFPQSIGQRGKREINPCTPSHGSYKTLSLCPPSWQWQLCQTSVYSVLTAVVCWATRQLIAKFHVCNSNKLLTWYNQLCSLFSRYIRESSQMIKHGHFQHINTLDSHPRNQDIMQSASDTVSPVVLLDCVSQTVLNASLVRFNALVCEIRKKPHILPSKQTSFNFVINEHSNFSLIFSCL